jgi:predicted amidohydrolase
MLFERQKTEVCGQIYTICPSKEGIMCRVATQIAIHADFTASGLLHLYSFLYPQITAMASPHLHLTLVQSDIVWEDKTTNMNHYASLLSALQGPRHVVVLPEMFSTGFSMAPEQLAETMDGPAVAWMCDMARTHRCILTGSLMIEENGHYYNRMLWVQPDGQIAHYDKRHLFAYAREDQHYTAGGSRTIVQVNGWRIALMVCYDLRFPVWARNVGGEYDVLLYVANWPQQRSVAWKTLLQARAIENQCYVAGVNRVGFDAKGNQYSGDSSLFGPMGDQIWQCTGSEEVHTATLDKDHLQQVRTSLPFLKDGDRFLLL